MAHKLAHSGSGSGDHETDGPGGSRDEWTVDRRGWLTFGCAALISLILGGGASGVAAGSDGTSVHWTNFSGGQL